MCQKSGPRLPVSDALLWRQGEPSLLSEEGEPSSQVFEPFSKDDGCLSVDDATKIDAATSFSFFTSTPPKGLGGRSAGVWALSIREVEAVGLEVWADPTAQVGALPANPHHVVVEFGSLGRNQRKKVAQKLKIHAVNRGKQHPVEGDSPAI